MIFMGNIVCILYIVTRPFYESRVNWVIDPVPPASRRPVLETSSAPTPAPAMLPSGDVSQAPKMPKVKEKEEKEGCAPNQSASSISPG